MKQAIIKYHQKENWRVCRIYNINPIKNYTNMEFSVLDIYTYYLYETDCKVKYLK